MSIKEQRTQTLARDNLAFLLLVRRFAAAYLQLDDHALLERDAARLHMAAAARLRGLQRSRQEE